MLNRALINNTTCLTGDHLAVAFATEVTDESEVEEDDLDGLVNTDERVQEALQVAQAHVEIPLELHPSDTEEHTTISEFILIGCGCKKCNHGKPC